MKKITFWILTITVVLNYGPLFSQNIVINEMLSSNVTSIIDENGSHEDWIELYNAGANPVNLLGHGLSDDPSALFKWTFPSVTLNPGQYLIVWASDKNRAVATSPLHTNFKLSSTDTIILTNPSGVNVATMPPVTLQADISYGRFPNGSGPYVYFTTPTPNAANTTAGYSEALSPPKFYNGPDENPQEFRTTGFNLTLTSSSPGVTILYTLDGSEPNQNNLGGTTYSYKKKYPEHPGQLPSSFPFFQYSFQTLTYTGPIAIADRSSQPNKLANISTTWDDDPDYFPDGPIFKATVVKAKAIKPGALPSETVTRNYFISPQGANRFTLPVVSVSFNENEFYDYTNGISVAGKVFDDWRLANPNDEPDNDEANWGAHGEATERIANLNYFVGGVEKINQKVGLRIHGDHSREYVNKSLRVYARSGYGKDKLEYPLFSDEPYTAYERVVIKNQGGDWNNTMFRDCLCNELVKDLRMETEAHQQVISIVNGEYWGILALRERYDDNYFKLVYDMDAVDLLHNHGSVDEGDDVDYDDFISQIENRDLSLSEHYTYIQTRMDIQNYMDYHISNIYLNNDDWVTNNVHFWRKKTTLNLNAPYPHDGRWRWAFHDVTSTFDHPEFDTLADATTTDPDVHSLWSTLILRKLLANTSFKIDFINRFADLMNTNFLTSRVVGQINSMAAVIAPEMNDQYFRWKGPESDSDWQYHLNREITFATDRPAYQRQHIRQKFGISRNINATLDVDNVARGYVKMNTINIKAGTPGITGAYPWTGIYFHNIPVKIKAVALPGYIFSHWEGASSSTNEEITITPTNDFYVKANFVPSGNSDNPQIIYFWMMNTDIPNDVPLVDISSSYEVTTDGTLHYESCLAGYPFTAASPNWRKASMERRNEPTSLNYSPSVNQNLAFENSNMRGIQIKQPFQNSGLENQIQLHFSTLGYKDIKLAFAVLDDEGAASGVIVDYSTNTGTPVWKTAGMTASAFPISNVYQRIEVDFTGIAEVINNPNLKFRIRFTGSNMTADTGQRVTFNNISIQGVTYTLTTDEDILQDLIIYPNPTTGIVHISSQLDISAYAVYSIDGRKILSGTLKNNEIDLSQLPSGLYLMQIQDSYGKSTIKKIVKQ